MSPTKLMRWLTCPTFGYLDERWEPTGPWTPNRLLGTMMHTAINASLTHQDAPGATLRELDRGYPTDEESVWTKEALLTLINKALPKVLGVIENFGESFLASELTIGEGRVDLVTQREQDKGQPLVVTDFKTSLQLSTYLATKNMAEAQSDWQLLDYTWRVSEYYQKPVIARRRVLIVLTPQVKTYCETFDTTTTLDMWHRTMLKEEAYVESLKDLPLADLPMRTTNCYGRYGKCGFYEFCWIAGKDEQRASALYNPRRTNV